MCAASGSPIREQHEIVDYDARMAPFKHGVDDGRIDLGILVNGSIFVYYDADYMRGIVDWFTTNNYRVLEADCSGWTTEERAYAGLRRALVFEALPYAVTELNPDLLNDDLEDIEVPDHSGTVLVLRHLEHFVRHLPRGARLTLDSLSLASRYHSLFGLRFMTIAFCGDETITFAEPVGGMEPMEER